MNDYSFVLMLIFGLVPFVLAVWLMIALIRWLNRH
jgi:hypothetical protein